MCEVSRLNEERCDSCPNQCEEYGLYVKQRYFPDLTKDGLFQRMPLDEVLPAWFNNRKEGKQVYIVRC
jgi:hypothetical protein